ncbi:hypothetical protein FHG87_015402 [Trinorchestia longiramus]|nr:hypothetical protein FHG87_015402 [Trinorchestia longiramus]
MKDKLVQCNLLTREESCKTYSSGSEEASVNRNMCSSQKYECRNSSLQQYNGPAKEPSLLQLASARETLPATLPLRVATAPLPAATASVARAPPAAATTLPRLSLAATPPPSAPAPPPSAIARLPPPQPPAAAPAGDGFSASSLKRSEGNTT